MRLESVVWRSSLEEFGVSLLLPLRLEVVRVRVVDGLPLARRLDIDDGDRVLDLDTFLSCALLSRDSGLGWNKGLDWSRGLYRDNWSSRGNWHKVVPAHRGRDRVGLDWSVGFGKGVGLDWSHIRSWCDNRGYIGSRGGSNVRSRRGSNVGCRSRCRGNVRSGNRGHVGRRCPVGSRGGVAGLSFVPDVSNVSGILVSHLVGHDLLPAVRKNNLVKNNTAIGAIEAVGALGANKL